MNNFWLDVLISAVRFEKITYDPTVLNTKGINIRMADFVYENIQRALFNYCKLEPFVDHCIKLSTGDITFKTIWIDDVRVHLQNRAVTDTCILVALYNMVNITRVANPIKGS